MLKIVSAGSFHSLNFRSDNQYNLVSWQWLLQGEPWYHEINTENFIRTVLSSDLCKWKCWPILPITYALFGGPQISSGSERNHFMAFNKRWTSVRSSFDFFNYSSPSSYNPCPNFRREASMSYWCFNREVGFEPQFLSEQYPDQIKLHFRLSIANKILTRTNLVCHCKRVNKASSKVRNTWALLSGKRNSKKSPTIDDFSHPKWKEVLQFMYQQKLFRFTLISWG